MTLVIYSIFVGIITSSLYIKCETNAIKPITKFQSPLTKATVSVILNFFITKTSVLSISRRSSSYAHKLEQSDIINDIIFMTKSEFSFQLDGANMTSQVPVASKRRFNIVFIDDYASFEKIFNPETIKNYDVTKYYLIIITTYNKDKTLDEIEKIFKFAWEYYIIHINVLVINPDFTNSVFIYTYFPYTDRGCADTTPVMFNVFNDTHFIKNIDFYSNKIDNMYQCPVYVAAFHTAPFIIVDRAKNGTKQISGFEMALLQTLAKRLNFQLVIKIPSDNQKWGEIFPNGTKTGAIKMLVDNEANLTVGSWSLTTLRLAAMDATQNYFYSDLVLVVPPGRPYSSFEKLILPFEPFVWIMIVLQFILSIFVVFVLKFVSEPIRNFTIGRQNTSPLLSMISVFLGGPMCYMPVRNFARTLAMIWMLGCLVIRSSYQGSLFNFLQVQKNFSAADTIDKIIERDFKFYVIGAGRAFLDSMPIVRDRMADYNILLREYYFERVRNYDFEGVMLSTRLHVAYMNYENRLADQYIIAKQHLSLFPITLFARKGSYLTARLNDELFRYISSGLIRYMKNAIVDDRFLKETPKTREPIKMNFHHIAGGYNLCMMFLGISVLVFLLEVLSKWVGWIKTGFDFLTYI